VVSPSAKLRIPGRRVRAQKVPDESRYGEKEVKKAVARRRSWEILCAWREFLRGWGVGEGRGGGGGEGGGAHTRRLTCTLLPDVNFRCDQKFVEAPRLALRILYFLRLEPKVRASQEVSHHEFRPAVLQVRALPPFPLQTTAIRIKTWFNSH
jgi:hypothetical protein